jgi:uncharacterized protein (TIGR03437 family)
MRATFLISLAILGALAAPAQEPAAMSAARSPESVFERFAAGKPRARQFALSAPELSLERPTASELKLLSKPQASEAVGVHRPVPAEAFARDGRWMDLEGGARVWRLRISSPGAVHLRLHFSTFSVGDGEVWIYAPDANSPAQGPFHGKGPWEDGDFWTAPLAGDTAVIEFVEAGAKRKGRREVPFIVDRISHIVKRLAPEAPQAELRLWRNHEPQSFGDLLPENAAACHEDVSCYASWAQSAAAVARISYEAAGGSFVCSGSLLNTRSSSFVPYFLTNAHCIDGPATARTVTAFFNFQTGSCTGPVNRPIIVSGATYLTGSTPEAIDYALIRLSESPAGAWFAGWNTGAPSSGAAITVIGHPAGDYKRIAFAEAALTTGHRIEYRYTRGLTEGGNSGGPFFLEPGAVRGVHARGNARNFGVAVCEAAARGLVSGGGDLFSAIYDQIRSYLEDGGACNITLTPSSLSLGAGGGAATITVNTASGCSWSASTNAPWISFSSATSGRGTANLGVSIAANTGAARSATLNIGGATATIQQAGAAPVCVPRSISPGTASGMLSASACTSPRRAGRAAALFTFNAASGQRVSIAMSSTAVDSFLYLIGPNGQIVAFDDDGGGGFNARIPEGSGLLTLPASGVYTIEATTYDPGEQGPFTLVLTLEGAGPGMRVSPGSLSFSLAPGAASAPQQVMLEGATGAVTVRPSVPWIAVETVSAATYRIAVNAAALVPGVYQGSVSFSTAAAAATLGVSVEVRPPAGAQCPAVAVALGGTISGVLDAGACRSSQRPALARRYAFTAAAGDQIRITLTSPILDTYLYLFAPNGQLLAEDDDSAGNLNSRIPPDPTQFLRLPAAGQYIIEATTYAPDETGPFTLRIETSGTIDRARPLLSRSGIVNGASNLANYGRPGTVLTGIAPGQLLAIYGANLGPDQLTYTTVAGNRIATSVAGTRVLIGGIPAPLLYVRQDQVGAVVPFAVGQLRETTVVVEAAGQASEPVSVPVISAAPGIFAAGNACACQGANGPISASNAAARGSIVTLYATGLGQTLPFGADGLLVFDEPLPRPILPVSVLVGGVAAEILYAGIAPGFVGVMQINIRIPSAAEAGANVPLQIVQVNPATGDTFYSQTGLGLAIR